MPDIDDLPDTMHDAEESSDRRPRNRDTIDWASRLSAAGQIDTSMEASSSPRSKASGVSPSSSRTSKRKRTSASRNDLGADMETTGGKSSKRRVSGKVKEEQSVSSVARISKRRRKREKQADVTGPPSVTADDDLNSLDEESVMGSQYDDFEENYTSSVDMPATKVISVTSEHSDIPLSLLELVDFWVRWLCVLSRRTFEVILWSHKSNDLIVSSLMGRKPSGGSHSKRPKTASEALRMKNWRNVSLKPDDIASVEKLLLWASKRNIVSKRRSVIEDRYTKSMEWIKIAEERLNGKNRVNIDKTVAFVKTGEKSLLFARPDLIQPLKEHIKKAKVWVSKLQRTSSDSVDMPMEVLDKMLPEADALALDLSEYIESVVEVTQVYCLCRQPHHGHMVACDSCDDWCHISCIGFTKAQAERADKFVCLRCNIHNSFKSAYATACKTVNTWMKPEDASRSLEIKRQKVLRKLNKDEKELIRLKADYSGVIAETTAHTAKAQKELDKIAAASAAAVSCALSGELGVNCKSSDVIASSNMNTVSDNQAAPISASVPVSVPCSTPSTANDVPRAPNSGICISSESNPSTETSTAMSAESTQKMGQATAEQALAPKCESIDGSAGLLFNTPSQPPIEELKRKERSLRYEINTVQSRVDRWRRENEEYTKFFALDLQCRFHFTEWMVAMQRILWPTTEDEKVGRPVEQGLPPGVEKRIEAAKLLGIDDLPEVKLILESFQWMAWCYRCLTTLRAPPTTKQLRKLIQDAKECRLSDDRIIKSLNGILSRSMSWKTKARKFLGMSGQSSSTPFTPRVLELSKAKQIFLEGNLNPIASRLKDMLRDCIEEASPSADDNRSGETGGKKSSAKSNAVDTHTISTPTALSISLKCRPPCSSDEDEPSSVEYTPTPSVYLAPRVDNIWPVNKDAPVEFKPYGPTYRHVFVNKEDHSVPTINTAVSGQVPFTAATNSSVEASISTSAPLAEKKRRRTSKPPSTQKAGRGFPYLPVHTTHKIITKDNTSSAPMVQAAFSTSTSSAAPQSGTNSTSVSGGSITSATVVGTSTAVASEGSKTSATVPIGPIASSLTAGGTCSTSNVPGATGASTGVAQEGSNTSATVPIGPIASSLAAGGTSSTSNVPGATGASTGVAQEGSKTSATVPIVPIASSLAAGGTSSTSNVPGATGSSTGVAQEGSKTSATVPTGPIASSLAAGGTSSTSNVPGATGASTGVAQEGSKTSATVPIGPIASSLAAGGTSSTSNVPGVTGASTGVAQEGSRAQTTESRGPITSSTSVVVGASTAVAQERVSASPTVPSGPIASLAVGGTTSTADTPGVTRTSTGVAPESTGAQATVPSGTMTSTLMTGATGIPSATVSGTSTTEQNNTIATTSAYEGADFEASVTSNTNPLCTGLTPYSANPDPTVASAPNMNSFSFVIPSSVDLNSNRQVHDNSRMEGPEIPSIGGDESEEPLSKRQRVDKGTHARNTAEPDGHPCDITRADS